MSLCKNPDLRGFALTLSLLLRGWRSPIVVATGQVCHYGNMAASVRGEDIGLASIMQAVLQPYMHICLLRFCPNGAGQCRSAKLDMAAAIGSPPCLAKVSVA